MKNVIKEEEQSFLRTLDQGLLLLDQIVNSSKSKIISGKKAFELYDTYGFPIDLTSIILDEKGISVDIDEFNFNGDFIESQTFAYLAVRRFLDLPISFPNTTRCTKPSLGGQIIKNF